ncbi:MAG: homoserine dehydrogenase [Microscillaceae bacterium]|nr:homoserine dehydrogenase [Microscillaceae bacterium]MDW8459606.1 homoserine dehydrogenase [Cytophagales bacterium]
MNKLLKIGMFGFGCVGQGLYGIFLKTSLNAEIIKICVKHRDKPRPIPMHHFTFDKEEILQNPDINLVVEMIDNADDAYHIVKTALQNGKNVVTANKKMLAEHLAELVELQKKYNVSLLYEASSCGSIPIIRNLEEYYDNDLLSSVSGIFNGSSNYILSKIFQEGWSYETALKKAQELGFAETDPTLDVGGFDAKYKLCIIAAHAYGIFVNPDDVLNYGIQTLSIYDQQYAQEKGVKIKLVASAIKTDNNEVVLSVLPTFIPKGHYLYHVENEYNAVIAEAAFADKQVFVGKGAGGYPTGSAMISDISANRFDYRYEYRKHNKANQNLTFTQNHIIEIFVRYHQESDLQYLPFEDISTQFIGKEFRYVIGKINLKNIFQNIEAIRKQNIFLVHTGK